MKQIDQAFFMACAFFQLTGLAQPLTESPDKIFLARPLWCEHAPEAGLVYVCTAGDLYALEEKTGALRWKKDGSKFNCFTTWINAGGRILEINTDANRKELDLAYTILDPLTGVETGESVLAGVRNINNYLPLPDNSGLVISYEKGVLVHKHGERKARLVSDKPNLNCNYFFPDGKTLLLTEKTAHETRGTGIVRLIDVAEGKETGEYYLDKGWELAWADISSRGQIVLKQWHEELERNRVEPLRIADGRTGKIIRETAPVDVNFRANWTPDGRFLCAHNFFAGNTMLFDPETGATRGDFPPEGHNLVDVTKITWTNDWPVLFTLDSGGGRFSAGPGDRIPRLRNCSGKTYFCAVPVSACPAEAWKCSSQGKTGGNRPNIIGCNVWTMARYFGNGIFPGTRTMRAACPFTMRTARCCSSRFGIGQKTILR